MKISSSRRNVYRNQLIANGLLLGFVALVLFAGDLLPYIMWIAPLILFFWVLSIARIEIRPNAKDGSQWHGVMLVAAPSTQQARTEIIYSDRIALSDVDIDADIRLNDGRKGNGNRSAIIYRRANHTWWVRNTGERPMQIVSNNQPTRPLPSRATVTPVAGTSIDDAIEGALHVGDTIEFFDRKGAVVERFLFRGATNHANVPNHMLPAGVDAQDANWGELFGASLNHHMRNLMLALFSVIITAGLLYLTDSGMQSGYVTLIDFGTSFASWNSIIFWHSLAIVALGLFFVAVDTSILIRSRSDDTLGLRRPKSILIPLLALLIMTGTVVGYRNEGRLFGAGHIQQIIEDNEQSALIESIIQEVSDKNGILPISVSTFLQAPTAQLPPEYASRRNGMLSDQGTRNAPGNTVKTIRYITLVLGLFAAGALVYSMYLVSSPHLPSLLTYSRALRNRVHTYLRNRPWRYLVFTNHLTNLWLIAMLGVAPILLAGQTKYERDNGIPLTIAGITFSELVRFGFFATIIFTIGLWAAQRHATQPLTMPVIHRWPKVQSFLGSRWLSLAITGVMVGAIAWLTRDVGPYLASLIFLLLVSMLYIGKYQNRMLQRLSSLWIGLVVVAMIGIPIILNVYRLDLVTNPLTKPIMVSNGSLQAWSIRPGEPIFTAAVADAISPYLAQGYAERDLIDDWYGSYDFAGTGAEYVGCDAFYVSLCQRDQSLRQGLYAILAGSIHGMGPGLGLAVQADALLIIKPNVANAHNDFVMITVFEEYGLIGGVVVMLIFYLLTAYLFSISQRIDSHGGQVLAAGLGIWWSLQVLMVMAGTLRLMPFAGISTPLISYGLTNTTISLIMLALTVWVSTMPLRPINKKPLTRTRTYRILQIVLFSIHFILVGMIVVMQSGWGIHSPLFKDAQQARTATPSTTVYHELSRPMYMGSRIDCQYFRNPKLNDIVDRNNQKLIYYQRFISGCYTTKRVDVPAQGYGAGVAELLNTLITSSTYESRISGSPIQGNVRLTLDGALNQRIDDIFRRGTGANQHPVSGQVIVLDYQGRIRAFVNRQERLEDGSERYGSTNDPLTGLFPPGSIWKILVTDAALRAGLPVDQPIPCLLGEWIQGVDTPRRNAYGPASCLYASVNEQGDSTLRTSLAYSLNTTFMGISDSAVHSYPLPGQLPLTRDAMATVYADYGVVDVIRNERAIWSSASLPATHAVYAGFNRTAYDNPNDPTWGTSLIGQGNVLASPLSMASIVQIIANNGVAQSIRLIEDDTNPAWHGTQRISAAQAAQLKALLAEAVRIPYENPIDGVAYLAGAAAVMDGTQHLVAGKTGTAEVFDPACNPASECPNLNWFVGFSDQSEQIVIIMFRAHTTPAPCSSASIAGAVFAELLDRPQAVPCSVLDPNQSS